MNKVTYLIACFSFAVFAALFYGCVADGADTIALPESYLIKRSSSSAEISSSGSTQNSSSSSDNAVSLSSVSSSGGIACATWGNWVEKISATCEKEGVETRTCTNGDSSPETRQIDKLEWGDWVITTPATLTEHGIGYRDCPNGNRDEKDDLTICGTDPKNVYAPEEQFCQNGTVKNLCGTATYTAEQSCQGKVVVDKCGSEWYNSLTQFCYNSSKLGNLCGNNPQKSYDPDLYECKQNSNGIYLKGGIKDSRDGKQYDAVLMGAQIWMAENLNYETDGSKCGTYITATSSGNYKLSDEDTEICNIYGRLYNWATALAFSPQSKCNANECEISEKHQGVCPSGWHIPSDADWNVLMKFVNPNCSDNSDCAGAGTKLKSVSDWNPYNGIPVGTDDYGFAALPGGNGSPSGDYLVSLGQIGQWWSTIQFGPNAYSRHINYNSDGTKYMGNYKASSFSVRCVRDYINE
ncbi:MAG: hypothetical protein LBC87_09740 [Fibromonadaceae bacterium]|jgi:uncharacterized protein (TIGR02145 family)|nr:hypothetical protein [Fibromonadaceae bacterium]